METLDDFEADFLGEPDIKPVSELAPVEVKQPVLIESPAKAKGRKPKAKANGPEDYDKEACGPGLTQGALYLLPTGVVAKALCSTEEGYSFLPVVGGASVILPLGTLVVRVEDEAKAKAAALFPPREKTAPAVVPEAAKSTERETAVKSTSSAPVTVETLVPATGDKKLAQILARALRVAADVLENG